MRYMDAPLWVWRDANFWPDFPTSAKAVEFFAGLDLDLKIDGVIAVDQLALKLLVGGLGSVVVPEYDNDVLTQDNVIAKIREYWAPPAGTIQGVVVGSATQAPWLSWYVQRKQFMSYLIQSMSARLEDGTRSVNMLQLGKSVLQALNEKHILIYLQEPLGWGGIAGANWGGAVAQTTGDYLFVVDTNMGFNKANGVVTRAIDYAVTIDAAGLARAQVRVSYDNPSSRDTECVHEPSYEATYDLMMNRCYWNYLRIYAPEWRDAHRRRRRGAGERRAGSGETGVGGLVGRPHTWASSRFRSNTTCLSRCCRALAPAASTAWWCRSSPAPIRRRYASRYSTAMSPETARCWPIVTWPVSVRRS